MSPVLSHTKDNECRSTKEHVFQEGLERQRRDAENLVPLDAQIPQHIRHEKAQTLLHHMIDQEKERT
jgi:hypothetical protein